MRQWNPTETDLKIYAAMKKGVVIDLFESLDQFRISAIRNSVWRLRKHGYDVQTDLHTTTKSGQVKRYAKYSVKVG